MTTTIITITTKQIRRTNLGMCQDGENELTAGLLIKIKIVKEGQSLYLSESQRASVRHLA